MCAVQLNPYTTNPGYLSVACLNPPMQVLRGVQRPLHLQRCSYLSQPVPCVRSAGHKPIPFTISKGVLEMMGLLDQLPHPAGWPCAFHASFNVLSLVLHLLFSSAPSTLAMAMLQPVHTSYEMKYISYFGAK